MITRLFICAVAVGIASLGVAGKAAGAQGISAVASLAPDEAREGVELTVRGTVTFAERGVMFFQDDAAGSYFRPREALALAPGTVVEARGRTAAGAYVPGLESAEVTVLREEPLPAAVEATYEDLLTGRFHYRRVSIDGVVRAVSTLNESRSLLRIAVGARVLDVWVEAPLAQNRVPVDSRVRVHGVAVGSINTRRQLVQPYVRALGWSEVMVLKPGVPDEAVPRTGAELSTHSVAQGPSGRVRVAGTVMASFTRGMLYLRTDKSALGVRLAVPVPIQVGDAIEVVGFAEMGRFTASLVDAKLVARQPGPEPAPLPLRIEDLFRGSFDGDLVQVTAKVTDMYRTDRERIIVLQENERRVRVSLLDPAGEVPVVGSLVQVTGISRVSVTEGVGYSSQPEAISVYARTPRDLVVLERPSAWTVRRLALISAILGGVIFFAVLWIALLRRQVRRQAQVARHRIETEAALEERNRLARDFHDTLEQELVGLGLRLDAVPTEDLDERRRTLISASRDLVSRIQAETRNLVGDLRDPRGRLGDLEHAFEDLLELNSNQEGPMIALHIPSDLPLLSAAVVHNLRMIARESVTNALKHAAANNVAVTLERHQRELVLTIADDGRGFDAAKESRGKTGHYGCVGIRERCGKIGAAVAWKTAPGEGTVVQVRLPLAGQASKALELAAAAGGK